MQAAPSLSVVESQHVSASQRNEYVTVMLGKQLIGIPVLKVQDVLGI